MRSTWLVLGLIVLVGGVAYFKLMGESDEGDGAAQEGGSRTTTVLGGPGTSLRRDQGVVAPASGDDAARTDPGPGAIDIAAKDAAPLVAARSDVIQRTGKLQPKGSRHSFAPNRIVLLLLEFFAGVLKR